MQKLIDLRLKRHKVKIAVSETTIAFPKPLPVEPSATDSAREATRGTPQPFPTFIPIPQYAPTPAPAPVVSPATAPASVPGSISAAPASPRPPIDRLLEEKLVDSIPLALGLIVGAILVGFAIRAFTRRSEPSRDFGAPRADADAGAPINGRDTVAGLDPSAEIAALRARLVERPDLRSALLKSLLGDRAIDRAARFVEVFGADFVNGERGRAEYRETLARVAERLKSLGPVSRAELLELVRDFRARLARHELMAVERDTVSFEFLGDVDAAVAHRVLARLSRDERAEVLPRVPAAVRGAFLATLSRDEESMFLGALLERRGGAVLGGVGLSQLAKRVEETTHAEARAYERDEAETKLFEDILYTRDAAGTRALFSQLARENPALCDQLLSRTAIDGVATACESEVLATTLLSVDPKVVRIYLASLAKVARETWFRACPVRLRAALIADVERLSSSQAGNDAAGSQALIDARRSVLSALATTLRARGASLADMNRVAIRLEEGGDGTSVEA